MKEIELLNINGTEYKLGGTAANDVMYQKSDKGYIPITIDDVINQVYKQVGIFSGFTMPNLLGNVAVTVVSTDSNGKRYACQQHVNINPQQGFFTVTSTRGNFVNADNNVIVVLLLEMVDGSNARFGYWMPQKDKYTDKTFVDTEGNQITDNAFYDNLKIYFEFLSLNCNFTEDIDVSTFGSHSKFSLQYTENTDPDFTADYLLKGTSLIARDTREVLIEDVTEIGNEKPIEAIYDRTTKTVTLQGVAKVEDYSWLFKDGNLNNEIFYQGASFIPESVYSISKQDNNIAIIATGSNSGAIFNYIRLYPKKIIKTNLKVVFQYNCPATSQYTGAETYCHIQKDSFSSTDNLNGLTLSIGSQYNYPQNTDITWEIDLSNYKSFNYGMIELVFRTDSFGANSKFIIKSITLS